MSRRVVIPGADELFRATSKPAPEPGVDLDREPEPGYGRSPDRPAGDGQGAASARLNTAPGVAAIDPDGSPPAEPELAHESTPRSVRRRPHAIGERRPTGRTRHEEKITVYLSADEVRGLNDVKETLRWDFGVAVDRGRLVREALAVVLADFDAKGEESILVRRLGRR